MARFCASLLCCHPSQHQCVMYHMKENQQTLSCVIVAVRGRSLLSKQPPCHVCDRISADIFHLVLLRNQPEATCEGDTGLEEKRGLIPLSRHGTFSCGPGEMERSSMGLTAPTQLGQSRAEQDVPTVPTADQT
ncbi:hypothetical protein WMY93_018593 [Mugilogobius chulae]|uniref:Uncharacterized protein n=1 Tax=Mugilogobius chulae TaxID=88201 RepID=A0AAW0NWL2_9GOBI